MRLARLLAVSLLAPACMSTPPPLPAPLVRAQLEEASPEAAAREYAALVARCQRGIASELVVGKDDCGTVAFRLGQSLEQLSRYDEAVQAFLAVRALSHDPVRISRALVRVASLQADHLAAPAQAMQTCKQVLAEFPAEVPAEDALRLWVRLRSEAGDPALAAELSQLAETLHPYETLASFALLYAAQAAARSGHAAEALAHYDAIWQRYPRGPLVDDALVAAAQLLRHQGRSAEAAERLERLARTYVSASVVGHYNQLLLIESMLQLGEIYLRELHRPAQAIATLSRLLKRQPSSRLADDALLLMAEAALQLSPQPAPAERRKACEYLARLQRDYPDSNHGRAAQTLAQQQKCP
jgi:TolA-binding protein